MPYYELLVGHAEYDFGTDDVSRKTDGVNLGTVETRAPGFLNTLCFFDGHVQNRFADLAQPL